MSCFDDLNVMMSVDDAPDIITLGRPARASTLPEGSAGGLRHGLPRRHLRRRRSDRNAGRRAGRHTTDGYLGVPVPALPPPRVRTRGPRLDGLPPGPGHRGQPGHRRLSPQQLPLGQEGQPPLRPGRRLPAQHVDVPVPPAGPHRDRCRPRGQEGREGVRWHAVGGLRLLRPPDRLRRPGLRPALGPDAPAGHGGPAQRPAAEAVPVADGPGTVRRRRGEDPRGRDP